MGLSSLSDAGLIETEAGVTPAFSVRPPGALPSPITRGKHARSSGPILSPPVTPRDLLKRRVNVESSLACNADHCIRSRRRVSHSQDSVALVEMADRDWVEDLIAAATQNNSPNSGTVGRGMKVAKEQIVRLVQSIGFSADGCGDGSLAAKSCLPRS